MDDWDHSEHGATATEDRLVKPPGGYLATAGFLIVVSLVLLPFSKVGSHIVGWLLASFPVVGSVAAYTGTDQRRRQSAWYSAVPSYGTVRTALLIAGLAVAGIHSWYIAYYYAS